MAASNCGRAASGIRPRSRSCPTTERVRSCTISSATIINGADEQANVPSTSRRWHADAVAPTRALRDRQQQPSGAWVNGTAASMRRCCRWGVARRVPRQSWPRPAEDQREVGRKADGGRPLLALLHDRLHASGLNRFELAMVPFGPSPYASAKSANARSSVSCSPQ
jgi:hypothetical protein